MRAGERHGGAWYYPSARNRPASRDYDYPYVRNQRNGFRVVCTAGLQ